MQIIRRSFAWVCLLLLCSCTTTQHPPVLTPASELPTAVAINDDAGRGNWLIINLRLEHGKELPFVVDTGSPVTFLDASLAPALGKTVHSDIFWNFGVKHKATIYAAPKLYLGNTQLMTGHIVSAINFKQLFSDTNTPIMGIIGMDCLQHYCLQLDFTAGTARFLDPDHMDAAELGNAFPITFSSAGQSDTRWVRPLIRQSNLADLENQNVMIDTGYLNDGALRSALFRRKAREQKLLARQEFELHPPEGNLWFARCVWDGETYTNLIVGDGGPNLSRGNGANLIGLRFLARHLVTLNFPGRTLYLKQASIGPLPGDSFVREVASAMSSGETAMDFMRRLTKDGKLPGWSKDDHGVLNLNFDFADETKSREPVCFEIQKNGDSSVYHYSVARVSQGGAWKLQQAWRTNKKGRTIEVYRLP